MTALRWGVLGTGWVAHTMTADLVANGFTVSAVGSRSQASADAFAAEFGIPTAHGSYEALVADPEVDVIYVTTPNPFHLPHAVLALDAGKHVLLEKPFTVDADEASELVQRAAEKNLVLLEAMWTRFVPHMVRVREIIAAGTLGEVRTLIADHSQTLPSDPNHRLNDLALAGGALLDLGVYPVSFAIELFGEPVEVRALGTKTATGVDRQTSILLGFSHGQQAVLQCALDTEGPNTASILGTEGWIAIDSVWHDASTFTVYNTEGDLVERFTEPVNGRGMHYQASELELLVDTARRRSYIMPPDQTITVMKTLDEIRRQIGLNFPSRQ
ncbi:MAG: Gfo/Idh/MocA family oxidoreductase [Pseudolysinimonas sp.]